MPSLIKLLHSIVFFPFLCINSLWGLELYSRKGDQISWLVPFVYLSQADWPLWCLFDVLQQVDYFYIVRIQSALWFILRYSPPRITPYAALFLLLKSKISFFLYVVGATKLSAAWLVLYRPITENPQRPSRLELFILFILFSAKYNYPAYTCILFILNEIFKKAQQRGDNGDPQMDIRTSRSTPLLLTE